MPTRVRSYSKINLGLRIGPVRPDGFHGLCTLYQTIGLFDVVTVSARRADETSIAITCNHPGVPCDSRNTVWKMVEGALEAMGIAAAVEIDIGKQLPVQGGLGAGSANAVAALVGLERELNESLSGPDRILLAGQVGSDCPLFLCGGTSAGLSRGEVIVPYPDLAETWCVVAAPIVGVSTPLAFKEWDRQEAERAALAAGQGASLLAGGENPTHSPKSGERMGQGTGHEAGENVREMPHNQGNSALTQFPQFDRLDELSRVFASVFSPAGNREIGASGVPGQKRDGKNDPSVSLVGDLAGDFLSELVRTGIANDFQEVAFAQHPSLRDILTALRGDEAASTDEQAVVAMLSGSGSSLFGLYRTREHAEAAKQRVESAGTRAMVTTTIGRERYWSTMFE